MYLNNKWSSFNELCMQQGTEVDHNKGVLVLNFG